MNIENAKKFLDELNIAIVNSETPLPGDYIATDWDHQHPSEFEQNISWYCSQVLEVNGDNYKVSYDDKWYKFKHFGFPKPCKNGVSNIYPAIAIQI